MIDRNLLGVVPALVVAVALGMARLRRVGVLALAGAVALCSWALVLVLSDPLLQREDWRGAAAALGPASVPRAIVYGPATNNPSPVPPLVPFQAVYLPSVRPMPDRGAWVGEIDELDVRDDLSDTSPPPQPVSPGRGFRLIAGAGQRSFRLYRFVSARPVRVTPDQLFGAGLLENRDESDSLIGLQLPAAGLMPRSPPSGRRRSHGRRLATGPATAGRRRGARGASPSAGRSGRGRG